MMDLELVNPPGAGVACRVCGSPDHRPFLDVSDHQGRPVRLLRCHECDLVQVDTLPSDNDLAAYYSRYSYDSDAAWTSSPATETSLDRLAARLARFRKTGRLLDVGCGAGVLLHAMARHGWTVVGTELSSLAAEQLRAAGLTVHLGHLEAAAEAPGSFDVIVLSEIIEHVREPKALLAPAVRLLRSGGCLYVTTPNIDSLSRRLLVQRWRAIAVPEHLHYFSVKSLRWLLDSFGLRTRSVWTEGLDPFALVQGLRGLASRQATGSANPSATEALREGATRRPALRAAKVAANAVLRMFRAGDTLKALVVRP